METGLSRRGLLLGGLLLIELVVVSIGDGFGAGKLLEGKKEMRAVSVDRYLILYSDGRLIKRIELPEGDKFYVWEVEMGKGEPPLEPVDDEELLKAAMRDARVREILENKDYHVGRLGRILQDHPGSG